jgi:hypothetical protein
MQRVILPLAVFCHKKGGMPMSVRVLYVLSVIHVSGSPRGCKQRYLFMSALLALRTNHTFLSWRYGPGLLGDGHQPKHVPVYCELRMTDTMYKTECNHQWTWQVFRRFTKTAKSDYYLRHVCLSACLQGTAGLPLDGFSWNLISEYFSKICRENFMFIKIARE